ncbi:MAG: iron-containing alcohol dehydrogenase [Myxococcales bacterium]|nr:iron-containing alcohol dehydrogenase [Myxococcales bacterium]
MEIVFELGGIDRVGAHVSALGGARVLLVCSSRRRHVERVLASLGSFEVAIFDGARVHVPVETVESAARVAEAHDADVVLTLGGGSATGLGKALRLRRQLSFVALPTTFSGSERTSIWGMTEGGDKRTGRDPRARPDVIVYDAELFAGLPPRTAVQSAMNALAHPLSALSTATLDAASAERARGVADALVAAVEALAATPGEPTALERALRHAGEAATILDGARLGLHHKLAHALGGRFGLEHAALHSALLPHTLQGELRDEQRARLLDAMKTVEAPVSLGGLGVDAEAARAMVAEREALVEAGAAEALERAL